MTKTEGKKPCNCGKKTLEAVAAYTEEGEDLLKKSLMRKIFDVIMTVTARIFASMVFIIIGLIAVLVYGVLILFTGTSNYGIDISKLVKNGRDAE